VYPWTEADDLGPDEAAKALYKLFRNPLSHSLGLETSRKGKASAATLFLAIGKMTMTKRELMELESATWPMRGTIEAGPADRMLRVKTLYWGLRESVKRLTDSETHTRYAVGFLSEAYREQSESSPCR
jgi:hypothetical protein